MDYFIHFYLLKLIKILYMYGLIFLYLNIMSVQEEIELAMDEMKKGLVGDEVKTKNLADGTVLVWNSACGMPVLPEKVDFAIAMCESMASANKVKKLEATNGVDTHSFDRCIKLYGVFLFNRDSGKTKVVGKYETVEEAEKVMNLIKNKPELYVEEDGNYKASIQLVIEMGRVPGDCIPAVLGATLLDKRVEFIF